jgi:hypothetical protein
MSTNSAGNSEYAALRNDFAKLQADVSGLFEHLKTNAASTANGAAKYVDDNARQMYKSASELGEQSASAIGKRIEEQPLVAMLIVLGLGYIGGRVMSR